MLRYQRTKPCQSLYSSKRSETRRSSSLCWNNCFDGSALYSFYWCLSPEPNTHLAGSWTGRCRACILAGRPFQRKIPEVRS